VNLANMEYLQVPLMRTIVQWLDSCYALASCLLFETPSASDHVNFSESFKALNVGYFDLFLPAALLANRSMVGYCRSRLPFHVTACLINQQAPQPLVFIVIHLCTPALPGDESYRKIFCLRHIFITMSHQYIGILLTLLNCYELID
jgi:hypothetical protein